jgi:CelD/BcsL family acetyltransferase involved in cellulose biosynthesis
VHEAFPGLVELLTIRLGDKPLAAMLLLKFRKQLSDPWAASLREYASLCPNMLMYWEALKYGCEQGFEEFDLGRSKIGSGPYRFKTQWGAEPVPLNYQVLTLDGSRGLASRPPVSSALMSVVSRIWRLVPLGVTRRLGPILRKRIP